MPKVQMIPWDLKELWRSKISEFAKPEGKKLLLLTITIIIIIINPMAFTLSLLLLLLFWFL